MNSIQNKFEFRDYGYTIISRFEKYLREYCKNVINMNFSDYTECIPEGVMQSSQKRNKEISDFSELLENIEFIHLKEIIVYKNNYNMFFDKNKLTQKEFVNLMDSLYALRCKIAHIRGYFSKLDLDALIEESKKIAFNTRFEYKKYIDFIDSIEKNPENLIIKTPAEFVYDTKKDTEIINNLPIADYEYEGGFVGREEDKSKIIKMLKTSNHRVITISGAGGVGKTALAVSIVREVIDNNLIKYDGVIWVSAKENKLTYLGIEDIEPTLKNYEELLDTILNVMGFDINNYQSIDKKEEDINTLFDCCEKVLLIIDNLETITDERIINFILDSHKNTTILITSRQGLGQVERRYELKELKEKEAIHLFRKISEDKSIKGLRKLDDNTIKKYVNKVYCYPLAIKWVLGQVAIGKDINNIIDNINESTSDISRFCFEQIYKSLTDESKLILCTLSFFEDSAEKGVIKYICNIDTVMFEDSISNLVLLSLIIPEQKLNKENMEINTAYSLLPLTRGYVRVQLDSDPNPNLKRIIQERIMTVETTMEEANRASKQYRFSLSNLGATTEEEKVAAMLAQTAYQKYQGGNYLEAVEDFKKATQIAPRFSSIYRNWAIIESNEEHWIEADNLMSRASNLSEKDTQIWLVWGNIKRKNNKIKEAYQYYMKAYKLSPNDNIVLNSLGQALTRLGDYKEAHSFYMKALNYQEDHAQTKHIIINKTCIAENLKRWSESYINDRNFKEAEIKLKSALENMESVLKLDSQDTKSCILYKEILLNLGFLYKREKKYKLAVQYFEKIRTMHSKKYKEYEIVLKASLEIIGIYLNNNEIDKAKMILNKDLERITKFIKNSKLIEKYESFYVLLNNQENRIVGKVIRWDVHRKFAIVEHINCPGETYFAHVSNFRTFINILEEEMLNKTVSFIPKKEEGKLSATDIMIISNDK
ncbi:tetratricopeptide repeat protein [Turicibacter sanguinis]|uniref:tetratricopeptide repeat protein n=1 Tax=Turicibacter sanguinis TaxID=154288 RepID=UPI0021D48D16|nr:NB-ARC domain-containing protein [Turicibacter sanguinis]MCU7198001.1 NB-ARC domain-containing protein [Turicibacter sanguinis]MDB8576112.1 NB-ARC domain-containing protein [Turicibacter sanguinis]MDB8578917.1 NB-ARC domain-containing protein [Turicibacter sanguinis]MDB8584730.1 NB-ARC domain-containing protein [Turicibacter sanguinis]MDB8587677.1 NB-ARC domain-containing protein [Turicibacter sanguinis]